GCLAVGESCGRFPPFPEQDVQDAYLVSVCAEQEQQVGRGTSPQGRAEPVQGVLTQSTGSSSGTSSEATAAAHGSADRSNRRASTNGSAEACSPSKKR